MQTVYKQPILHVFNGWVLFVAFNLSSLDIKINILKNEKEFDMGFFKVRFQTIYIIV